MAAHHRGRAWTRRRRDCASPRGHRAFQSRRPRSRHGRDPGGAARGPLRQFRHFRARLAVRGLWHGVHRGDGAWPSRDRDHGRRHPGDGAGGCAATDASRRRRCFLVCGAAADRGFRGAFSARRGGAVGGGRASHVGTGGGIVLSCARDSRVTRFSSDWLALRESYDARARNRDVLDALAAVLADRGSVAIVDLASGAGATLRAIASRLPRSQRWRLAEHALELLAPAPSTPAAGREVATIPADIAREIEAVLEEPVDLVTASALLDLVSDDWLDRLGRGALR